MSNDSNPSLDQIRKEVEALKWHHSIDLGNGIVTPGQDNSAKKMKRLNFPDSFKGKTVLDIGSWDGFFAFEAEPLLLLYSVIIYVRVIFLSNYTQIILSNLLLLFKNARKTFFLSLKVWHFHAKSFLCAIKRVIKEDSELISLSETFPFVSSR